MIIFKLDPKFKKRFPDLDIDALSLVYSVLFDSICKSKKKRNYRIYIKMTAGISSYYTWQAGTNVRINLSDVLLTIDVFHQALLHEFRHFVQDKVFKIPLTKKNYDETTEKSYMSSPVEIDAGYFEMMAYPRALRLYNRITKLKNQFREISGYKGNTI